MSGTGVRSIGLGADPSGPADPLAGLDHMTRSERISALRAHMSTMGAAVPDLGSGVRQSAIPHLDKDDVVPVPDMFGRIFPGGGLPRRAVTCAEGSSLLMVELLAHVTAGGGYAAVIGWPDLAYAGVIDAGGICEHLIAIPEPGTEPMNVAAVLAEGLDLVIYNGPETNLSPVRSRPLLGKLRRGTAALVMIGTTVPSPALSLSAEVTSYSGIGSGTGRIRGVNMTVRAHGKGLAPVSVEITIGKRPASAGCSTDNAERPQLRIV